ncbi:MAG: general secretion pathway protein GspM [Leptothrix sp. (in: Bacteria)]|nr:general secretion pathway protein GspM [Leptothrix sp. (in: b-proteobacteria)]
MAPLRGWWRALPDRDRRLLRVALAVLVIGGLWLAAVQPALRTLRTAPAALDAAEAQLQAMQRLANEAVELRAMPPVNAEQAKAALQAASERLGEKGKLSLQGERAVLTLNGVGTGELRDWLAQARSGARARPVEASLIRGAQGYSGTLVLAIGGAP